MDKEIEGLQQALAVAATDWFAIKKVGAIEAEKMSTEQLTEYIYNTININAAASSSFKGIALPSDNPGAQTVPVFYIGRQGIYPNFGGVEITDVAGFIIWTGLIWSVVNLNFGKYITTDDFEYITSGRQLFNKAKGTDGFLISSNGGLDVNASYGVSEFIKITPGLNYNGIAVNGTGMRRLAFFNESKVNISGNDNLSFSFIAPAGAIYVRISYYVSGKETFMLEQLNTGEAAHPYEIYKGEIAAIRNIDIRNAKKNVLSTEDLERMGIKKPSRIEFNVLGDSTKMLYSVGGRNFNQALSIYRTLDIDRSNIFDVGSMTIDGLNHHILADNAAPYRVMGTTIGAGHGYIKKRLTATAHGKTNVDVGSTWKDSSNENWVMLNIFDANSIDFAHNSDAQNITGSTLVHVSGASHTTNINFTANATSQFYPPTKNRTIKTIMDGVVINKIDGSYFGNDLSIVENYDIMDKVSLLNWLKTQVGTSTKISQFSGNATCTVNIRYAFDGFGTCTIYSDFTAIENIVNFQDIMFVMSEALRDNGSTFFNRKYYIPKSLPFTFESVSYDFTNPTLVTNTPFAGRLQLTPSMCEPTGILCDRLIQFISGFTELGFAMGFLPVLDSGVTERRVNAINKALEISESKKVYMSAIDGVKTSLLKGDNFSVIAYKSYFLANTNRTSLYFVSSKDHHYAYIDWHTAKVDVIEMPDYFSGKKIEVVEKSANVSLFTKEVIRNIVVEVTSADNYGYLIFRVNK